MNGPPTPPLAPGELPSDPIPAPPISTTSTTEPAAEPTSSAPPAESLPSPQATSSVQGNNTSYYIAFARISTLAASGHFGPLVETCERAELEEVHESHPTHLLVTVPLVLGYLILDDLPPAQQALIRLPRDLTHRPILQALFNLLASTWERKHDRVFPRAENVLAEARKDGLLGADEVSLGVVAGLVTAFLEAFRTRTFALISRAYTSIPIALAQTYLGLPQGQLLSAAQTNGWTYNASTQILTPAPPSARAQRPRVNGFISAPSSLSALDLVTNSVARLEA